LVSVFFLFCNEGEKEKGAMAGIGPVSQDWEPVVVRKKAPSAAAKKDEKAVNEARRAGGPIETIKKCKKFPSCMFVHNSFWKCCGVFCFSDEDVFSVELFSSICFSRSYFLSSFLGGRKCRNLILRATISCSLFFCRSFEGEKSL